MDLDEFAFNPFRLESILWQGVMGATRPLNWREAPIF